MFSHFCRFWFRELLLHRLVDISHNNNKNPPSTQKENHSKRVNDIHIVIAWIFVIIKADIFSWYIRVYGSFGAIFMLFMWPLTKVTGLRVAADETDHAREEGGMSKKKSPMVMTGINVLFERN